MAAHDLLAGDVIDDRYRLIRMLGEGGAGVVWSARDAKLNIKVALKFLRQGLARQGEMRSRFEQEAELSARMLSPHIVKILSTGVTAMDVPFIVYEHLDGSDLGERLAVRKTLPPLDMKMIVVHVARALARAHSVGVLHRDVKPENIFLTTDPEGRDLVKVLDFGVAELTKNTAQEIAGTLEYIAPEVLLAEQPPDFRTDLYALAVVAYECCVGRPPFPADNVGQLVLAYTTQKVEPTGRDRSLDGWFAKALARDPNARFATAKEMAEALHVATRHLEAPKLSRELRAAQVAPAPSRTPSVVDLPPMRAPAASFIFEDAAPPSSQYFKRGPASSGAHQRVRPPASAPKEPVAEPMSARGAPSPEKRAAPPLPQRPSPPRRADVRPPAPVASEPRVDRPTRKDPRSES